ncbi:hypothetical protein [Flaviaesturariibacter aridisoli]|uniref:Uncharacterized protein n=1 Tax=Flaviaesturariibacter aridisoli TaxID=2545761 RepID=A0A4R4DWI5_9BACT|nr:hypothetical protein [Flaviaesturariibacter aridisoli]TCZ65038.1 hypothetical protein E0486_17880 [Flaviaesturariibacter aridisoli]
MTDNLVEEVLQNQAYLDLKKAKERETFALSLVKERGEENYVGYTVARLAEKEYQQCFKSAFLVKIEAELAQLRAKESKVSKAKAQSVLGISKSDLEAIWYKAL